MYVSVDVQFFGASGAGASMFGGGGMEGFGGFPGQSPTLGPYA